MCQTLNSEYPLIFTIRDLIPATRIKVERIVTQPPPHLGWGNLISPTGWKFTNFKPTNIDQPPLQEKLANLGFFDLKPVRNTKLEPLYNSLIAVPEPQGCCPEKRSGKIRYRHVSLRGVGSLCLCEPEAWYWKPYRFYEAHVCQRASLQGVGLLCLYAPEAFHS